jgi:hypothetical protein
VLVDADELATVELGAGSALLEADPSPPDALLPPDESFSVDVSLPVSLEDDGSPSFFALALRAALERSFLAHPLPRNTIAGGDIAFLSDPPQTSQVVGPSAWMPCITSVRRPHCEQT